MSLFIRRIEKIKTGVLVGALHALGTAEAMESGMVSINEGFISDPAALYWWRDAIRGKFRGITQVLAADEGFESLIGWPIHTFQGQSY